MAEQFHCFKKFCPHNGRGFFFNKLFHQVERFRSEDRIDEVRQWIEDLRLYVPKPEHSFFL